jgi:hypothetical protein
MPRNVSILLSLFFCVVSKMFHSLYTIYQPWNFNTNYWNILLWLLDRMYHMEVISKTLHKLESFFYFKVHIFELWVLQSLMFPYSWTHYIVIGVTEQWLSNHVNQRVNFILLLAAPNSMHNMSQISVLIRVPTVVGASRLRVRRLRNL